MELIVCIFAVVLLPGWAIPTFINWYNERDQRKFEERYRQWCWQQYWASKERDRDS